MSVSSISTPTTSPQQWQNVFQQQRQDFNQLAQALQSGDLEGAQKAFANLQSLQPSNGPNSNSSANPIQNDFAALGQALSSGNLSQAQSDFSQLQSDLKSGFQNLPGTQAAGGAHRGHHHHHHSVSSSQDSTSSTTDTTNNSSSSATTTSDGAGVNVTA